MPGEGFDRQRQWEIILGIKWPQLKEEKLRKAMVTLGGRSMTMQSGVGVVGQNVINSWKRGESTGNATKVHMAG